MTNEEKLQILRGREDRAYELLRTLEPTDPAFGTCLDNSRRCMYARGEITMDDVDKQLCNEMFEPVPEAEQPQPDPADRAATWEPGGGEAVEEEPAPADAPAQEEAEAETETPATNEDPQLTLTLNDMRDKLTPISIKYGNDLVAEAMNEMGYAKLSGVPAARYGELLKKVEGAVRCRQ